jgi:hypothetical protein
MVNLHLVQYKEGKPDQILYIDYLCNDVAEPEVDELASAEAKLAREAAGATGQSLFARVHKIKSKLLRKMLSDQLLLCGLSYVTTYAVLLCRETAHQIWKLLGLFLLGMLKEGVDSLEDEGVKA